MMVVISGLVMVLSLIVSIKTVFYLLTIMFKMVLLQWVTYPKKVNEMHFSILSEYLKI